MVDTDTHTDALGASPAGPNIMRTDSRRLAGVHGPLGDLNMAELRHPTEPSRFALALVALALAVAVAVFVLVSLGQATILIIAFVSIIAAVFVIWIGIQVWRIRLLGDAVLVSPHTLPKLQEVLDTVRARLGYTRRVDVFVVDKISNVLSGDDAPISLTSFFGMHVLVAQGDALGDLDSQADREQLLFTLATYVGALKARYAQWWSPLFTAFQMTGLTVFVWPFVFPYYRATVYSGDRIAYACCGDLDVSLQAVYGALVGKEIAPHLHADGLIDQALSVRRRKLLRFAQLLRPTPHATNRYLDLLAFVRHRTPDAFEAHRSALGTAGHQAEPVLAALGGRRSHQFAAAVGVALAALVLLAGLLTGLTARNSPIARALADAYGGATSKETATEATEAPSAPPAESSPTPTETTSASSYTAKLLALVPVDIKNTCTTDASAATVATRAAVTCSPTGGAPASLWLYAYTTSSDMTAAFEQYVGDLPTGSCSTDEGRQGTWSYASVSQGPMACYISQTDGTKIVWGSNDKAVLAVVYDAKWAPSELYTWWVNNAPNLQ
jgi:hypothetical protein